MRFATSPNTSCEHSTRKLTVVDVFPHLYIGFENCKNSELLLPYKLWGLGKIPSHPPPILKNMKHDLYFLARPRNFLEALLWRKKGRLQEFIKFLLVLDFEHVTDSRWNLIKQKEIEYCIIYLHLLISIRNRKDDRIERLHSSFTLQSPRWSTTNLT